MKWKNDVLRGENVNTRNTCGSVHGLHALGVFMQEEPELFSGWSWRCSEQKTKNKQTSKVSWKKKKVPET